MEGETERETEGEAAGEIVGETAGDAVGEAEESVGDDMDLWSEYVDPVVTEGGRTMVVCVCMELWCRTTFAGTKLGLSVL
jgi:hypothetical protein